MGKNRLTVLVLVSFCLATVSTASPVRAWQTTVVDVGSVLAPPALVVDGSDKVHLVYRDTAYQQLQYATNSTGSWVTAPIGTPFEAGPPSIAVDKANHLHIACSAAGTVKYITNASGDWVITDIGPGVGPSIAVDPSGALHLSSSLNFEANYYTNSSGSWAREEVSSFFWYPHRTSIAVDGSGQAHLSFGCYMDFYYLDGQEYYATNTSGAWVVTPLPLAPLNDYDRAWNPSLTVDASDNVHMSYLSILILGDTVISSYLVHATNAGGNLIPNVVAWNPITVSTGFPDSTAIVTDSRDNVHISYTHCIGMEPLSSCTISYATNASGSWIVSGPLAEHSDTKHPAMGVDSSGQIYIGFTEFSLEGTRLLLLSGNAEAPIWPGTPAEASQYGQKSKESSRLFNNLAGLVVSMGTILCLRRFIRKSAGK